MSRPLRIQYPDAWYHVMNRGRRKESVFLDKRDYSMFVELLKEIVVMYKVRVAAYCLIPNHYHLLIQTPGGDLSRCMRHLNGIYTQRFNRAHHCDGQLFRGRYKSILVDADSYLLELVRYIHRNPLEAGLVKDLNQYAWSSHKGYLSDAKKWDWLHKSFILSLFARDRREGIKTYKKFVSMESPEEINRIFSRGKFPPVLGSEKFINRVKKKFFHKKRHDEIPESRGLAPGPEKIKKAVCKAYGIEESSLLSSRRGVLNEPRNVAIFLIRRLRGEKLEEIGRQFGIAKYSSVSSAIEKMKREISADRRLKARVKNMEKTL
ncbi:MAG: transposase [Candidatus Thorarchaeota archaeon]|nr:MAG: transposase [Candidatus Thorarchaeota archaeon]